MDIRFIVIVVLLIFVTFIGIAHIYPKCKKLYSAILRYCIDESPEVKEAMEKIKKYMKEENENE